MCRAHMEDRESIFGFCISENTLYMPALLGSYVSSQSHIHVEK